MAKVLSKRWAGGVLTALLFASAAQAQELWPGMDAYLRITFGDTTAMGNIPVLLTNLYSSPLVDFTFAEKCTDGHHGFHGENDAAVNNRGPSLPGQTVRVDYAVAGCTYGIMSAIWADGKEFGDPALLRDTHECRAIEEEEVHLALEGEISKVPVSQWDPALSLTKLKKHLDDFPLYTYTDDMHAVAMQGCHKTEIAALIDAIQGFQKNASQEPDKYALQRGRFLLYLKEIEKALGSPTYPAAPFWWKGFN